MMREGEGPSQRRLDEWERRVSDARARLTSEIVADDTSPLRREGRAFVDELRLAFEELQVAEEELHVQLEEVTASRRVLDTERRRYRALFEHAPVAYVVTDPAGVIRDANAAASKLLGVEQFRLAGKPMVVFVPPKRRRSFRAQLNSVGESDVALGLHFPMHPRQRGVRNITATVGVVREGGEVVELRWLLLDDTARRRREKRAKTHTAELARRVEERTAELQRAVEVQQELTQLAEAARAAAERASREKTELIAIVSHELRTPLAAIGGYAELLALDIRGALNPAQRADIARIQEAQSHILHLVDDLVGYSKLETGRLRFEINDVMVSDSIEAVLSLIRPQAAAKRIAVRIAPPADSIIARADEERLRQIVLNLLSNAVKFTPADGHVSVEWFGSESNVTVRIRDDGIGIPPEKLELVFEPYVQLNAERVRTTGWGLGLAISRDLARAMGGDLTASSSPERGTVFTLVLPRSIRIASENTADVVHGA